MDIAAHTYDPPQMPAQYASKGRRLSNCAVRIAEAPKVSNCLWLLKAKFEDDCAILQECHTYERELALWESARVCQRCGEMFVTETDFKSAKASFAIPEWRID